MARTSDRALVGALWLGCAAIAEAVINACTLALAAWTLARGWRALRAVT